MKILDSSVIIAFFRKNEKDHVKAVDIFLKNDDFLIPECVVSEVLTVLKMREGFEVARKSADFLMHTEGLEIRTLDFDIFFRALDFFTRGKNKLSFVDTLLLVFSKLNRVPLITFDKELLKYT